MATYDVGPAEPLAYDRGAPPSPYYILGVAGVGLGLMFLAGCFLLGVLVAVFPNTPTTVGLHPLESAVAVICGLLAITCAAFAVTFLLRAVNLLGKA